MLAAMLVAGIVVAGTNSQIAVDRMGDVEFAAKARPARSPRPAHRALAWFRRRRPSR
jgi:hypothetical protein